MGLMLSLLVTCVGVLEALACWHHFRAGYLPLPVAAAADDDDAKYAAGSSSSSSDDSGSVRSLGAYYCSDGAQSKYGLTPILYEHLRKQPSCRNRDDCAGGGGSGREGHCGDVSGCAELVLDTLPTIQEWAQEPEEEQQQPPTTYRKHGDSFTELPLHENCSSAEAGDEDSTLGATGNSGQRSGLLDENENISENWSVGERPLPEDKVLSTSCAKPRPPELVYKAPTVEEDIEPREFKTTGSLPKGTVNRVFTVQEIKGGLSETITNTSVEKFSTAAGKCEVPETSLTIFEEHPKAADFVDPPSSYAKGKDGHGESKDSTRREKEEDAKIEMRTSPVSETWAEADAVFQQRPSSRSPQRSQPKKLPKNVDISWPSLTPQQLLRRASATPTTAPAQPRPPAAGKRRASVGDIASDLPDAAEGKDLRSSSVGPRTRRSTESADRGVEEARRRCGHVDIEKQATQSSRTGPSAAVDEDFERGSSQERNGGPFGRETEQSEHDALGQDIPYINRSTNSCHSIIEPKLGLSIQDPETESSVVGVEKIERCTTSTGQAVPVIPQEDDSPGRYVTSHADDQFASSTNGLLTLSEELKPSSEEEAEKEIQVGEPGEKFATEKNEPPKTQKKSVRISSFEAEEEGKAQKRRHRSEATEQLSEAEGGASQSECSAGEPFWLIFSGEYTKAMSKDWHSGHFSCWQCDESLTGQRYVLRDDHPYCIKCYESVFANVCEECNKIIGIDSKDLSYKEKHWHEACFLCNKCRVSLVDKQFGSKGEKIYCGNCYDSQFASRCDGCGEIFRAGTKKMEYKTRQWHEKCFCCCVCKTPIGTKSFIPREQEIYCAGCYEEKFATRCVKCNKIITSGGVTYKNEPWHRECFTCTNCNTSLAGQRFTSRDEKPYCADCFGELFAKRCTACSKPITGIGGTRFISFEDRHWHNDCFICAMCKTSLVGRGFITDADDIICPDCAKQKLM